MTSTRFVRTLLCAPLAISTTALIQAQQRQLFDRTAVEHLASLSSPALEAKPSISADRLTLWYASAQIGGAGELDLWVATRPTIDSPFGPASNVTELNGPGRDHTPTTTADGLCMVFSSNRPGGVGTDDAWLTTRPDVNSPWGPPVNLPEISSTGRDMGFSMSPDGLEIWFTSNSTPTGLDFDIFHSTRPDRNSPFAPRNAVSEINTPWQDKFPTVTGDGLTMYFPSNRPGSVLNPVLLPSDDVWVAMRPSTSSPWTVVENVFEINTTYTEYLLSISDDGEELFFVSDRPGTLGSFDLYRMPVIPNTTRYGKGTPGLGLPQILPTGGDPQVGNLQFGMELRNVSQFAAGFLVHSVAAAPAPSPFVVDLALSIPITFQSLGPNLPPEFPRHVPVPLGPGVPVGLTSYWQIVMVWDLNSQTAIGGVPFSASPGVTTTYFQ